MNKWIYVATLLAVVAGCNWSTTPQKKMGRFFVTGGRLYVLLGNGSYGSEGDVYTTDDSGRTWTKADVPQSTCDLASNAQERFALTSKGEIWWKGAGEEAWTALKRGQSTMFGKQEYLYSILAAKDGTLCVATNEDLRIMDRNGKLLTRLPSPKWSTAPMDRELFCRVLFASDDEREVILETDPFSLYVVDLAKPKLQPWTDGIEGERPDGMYGACKVIRHGDGFLMSCHDGVYMADGVLKPWRRVSSKRTTPDDYLRQEYCRAFCSFDASKEQWLMADGSGIHLMEGGRKLRTVFEDKADDHDLIVDITPHDGKYFVSFARLKPGVLGVALSGDLSRCETLLLTKGDKPCR